MTSLSRLGEVNNDDEVAPAVERLAAESIKRKFSADIAKIVRMVPGFSENLWTDLNEQSFLQGDSETIDYLIMFIISIKNYLLTFDDVRENARNAGIPIDEQPGILGPREMIRQPGSLYHTLALFIVQNKDLIDEIRGNHQMRTKQ